MLCSLDISASGLTAQRLRMDIIAENIANAQSTRSTSGTGQAYQRKVTVMQTRGESTPFSSYLDGARDRFSQGGVAVTQIATDTSPYKLDYNPTHPDANEDGYVEMPNVDTAREMVDMMAAQRSYEANIAALNAFKSMANKALEIGR